VANPSADDTPPAKSVASARGLHSARGMIHEGARLSSDRSDVIQATLERLNTAAGNQLSRQFN